MVSSCRLRLLALSLAVGLSALIVSAKAQVSQPAEPIGQARPYTPAPGWGRERTVARIYLGEFTPAGYANLIDVVWKSPYSTGGIYDIDFVTGWPGSPKTVLVYPESYSFLGADLEDDDMLMTQWSAADRAVLQVFHLVKGGASLVFEKSGMGTVEYWHSTVLVTESAKGSDGEYHYTTTGLWQWNGQKYSLAATVLYNQRLKALAKLEHEPEKK